MGKISAIPEGLRSLTPNLTVEGAADAIAFYGRAFGAVEVSRVIDPGGTKVWHAMLRFGDSILFINDAFPGMSEPMPTKLWIYSEGIDAAFKRAVDAGAKATMPPMDMFWGDRMAQVTDRWGNLWALAERTQDLSPDEMKKAQDAFLASQRKKE